MRCRQQNIKILSKSLTRSKLEEARKVISLSNIERYYQIHPNVKAKKKNMSSNACEY